MRFQPLILILGFLAGCARDDTRLHGEWRSNRDATVAAAFQRDPRWTNGAPEKVERFRDMFGHMTVIYSNGMATSSFRGESGSFRYRVIERGSDFVVIRSDAPMNKGRDIRIRFDAGGASYWIETGPLGFGLQEKFDRVAEDAGVQTR